MRLITKNCFTDIALWTGVLFCSWTHEPFFHKSSRFYLTLFFNLIRTSLKYFFMTLTYPFKLDKTFDIGKKRPALPLVMTCSLAFLLFLEVFQYINWRLFSGHTRKFIFHYMKYCLFFYYSSCRRSECPDFLQLHVKRSFTIFNLFPVFKKYFLPFKNLRTCLSYH